MKQNINLKVKTGIKCIVCDRLSYTNETIIHL